MFPLIAVFTFFLLIAYLTHLYLSFRQKINTIDGPPVGSLLLGNLDHFVKPRHMSKNEYLQSFYRHFSAIFETFRKKGVFRMWIGPFNVIYVLTKADYIKNLLSSHGNVNKGVDYNFFSAWLGDGLLISKAATWRRRRKLLVTGFHVKILHDFLPIFSRHTDNLLGAIESRCTQTRRDTVLLDTVMPLFEDLTLDIVKETSFGLDPTQNHHTNATYRRALKTAFFRAITRVTNPLHWFDLIYGLTAKGRQFNQSITYLNGYAQSVINKRIQLFTKRRYLAPPEVNNNDSGIDDEPAPEKASDATSLKGRLLLDILLKRAQAFPGELTTKAIQSEVNTFILGGHDTTAMALTFTTFMVGHHPEVQSRVFQELETIFGPSNLYRSITSADLRQMRYLEMTIKESLRLYPSIQIIGRTLSEPLPFPDGTFLSAGSTVYLPLIYLHRDPEYFPKPDTFIPERFSAESKPASQYAFLPFSSGPRNCIGQRYAMLELKYVLASIFRKYRVRSVTDPGSIIRGIAPILKPINKIEIEFERRVPGV